VRECKSVIQVGGKAAERSHQRFGTPPSNCFIHNAAAMQRRVADD
jgi:hypothetical protein